MEDKRKNIFSRVIDVFKRISGNSTSRQFGVFLIFVFISGLLWLSMTLNEEVQRDIVCEIKITNVPDSVTFITTPPETVTANVRARGTQLLRYLWGKTPTVEIDFRYFNKNNMLIVSRVDFRTLLQTALGDVQTIQAMSPDTIRNYYTTLPPMRVPVEVCTRVIPNLNTALYGPVVALHDTVEVYAVNSLAADLHSVKTEKITIQGVDKSCVRRVALDVPAGCRVIPDSVDLKITVEPVITKTILLPVRAVNVPENSRVSLNPSKVQVQYRVKRSKLNEVPNIDIIADFGTDSRTRSENRVLIRPRVLNTNVIIAQDSVEYKIRPVTDEEESVNNPNE